MFAPTIRFCVAVCVVVLSLGRLAYAAATYSAVAVIGSGSIVGTIRFQKGPNCSVLVSGLLAGLRPNSSLGLHVHEAGDLTDGCNSTGVHWNPTNATHGGPSSNRSHAGDLGNLQSNGSGYAAISVSNPVMSSFGLASLYGRSIVLHNQTDDLGSGSSPASKTTGNSGARIACAVIGMAADLVSTDDCSGWAAPDAPDSLSIAVANFVGGSVTGTVQFRTLPNCSVEVVGTVGGLRPNALQASHVHAVGDLTGPCNNTGSHYNPDSKSHGSGTNLESHVGDMGNLRVDGNGLASYDLINPAMTYVGVSGLYGLAVVIHNLTDDLGLGNNSASLSNGNSGTRIACAVIGRAAAVTASSPGKCQSSLTTQPSSSTLNIVQATNSSGDSLSSSSRLSSTWNILQAAMAGAAVQAILLLYFTKQAVVAVHFVS